MARSDIGTLTVMRLKERIRPREALWESREQLCQKGSLGFIGQF